MTFRAGQPMAEARAGQTLTLLSADAVLVAGGAARGSTLSMTSIERIAPPGP